MTREETWDTEKSMRKDENLSETGGVKFPIKLTQIPIRAMVFPTRGGTYGKQY